MKLETFFEKFDQFADAPDAVAKMRALVLQLAVQGNLVEQRSSEPSAGECVRKANKPLVDFVPDETMENPAGWVALPLGSLIASNTGGGTPSKQNPSYWNGPIPWASVKDVQSEKYLTSTIDSITEEGLKASTSNLIPPNRLIVVTRMGLGKLAINTIPVAINQDLRAIQPTTALELDFAYLLFKSLKMVGSGVTVKGITVDKLHAMTVLLPPLAEQKRIVAKVDELMALCDRLETQQRERETRHAALARASLARFADAPTPANLPLLFHPTYAIPPADLRKSILTLAVQGKLVPQDPNDEPAEVLLEAIAKQREKLLGSASLRKTKVCRQFTSNEVPHDIPGTWTWTMLGEITDIGSGSTPSRTDASFWVDGTIPWITSGSTSRSPITEGDELVTLAAVKAHRLRVYPRGTLLVALYGQGKTRGQVATLEIPATINQACSAICPLDGTPSMQGYLKLLLEKQYDEMRSLSAGGAQPNLNVQKIKELFVALPPLDEQTRIVAKVKQLMALVDKLEEQLTAARTTAGNLLSAIVSELTIAR
jgi:type I restriction enzyme S subunit